MSIKNIAQFAKRLSNTINVPNLVTEVNRIRLTAGNELLPMLEKMAPLYDGKYQSKGSHIIMQNIASFDRKFPYDKLLGKLAKSVKVIEREAAILEDRLLDSRTEVLMGATIDVKHTQALRFLSAAEFYLDIARAAMVCIVEFENQEARGIKHEKASLNYVERNFSRQNVMALVHLSEFFEAQSKSKPIIDVIYKMPDVEADEDLLTTIQSSQGLKTIEPAGFGALDLVNPIFYLYITQKAWSEYKLHKMTLAEKELEYLELRHQELIQLKEGKASPALDSQIEAYEDAIALERNKIKKLKGKLGENRDA